MSAQLPERSGSSPPPQSRRLLTTASVLWLLPFALGVGLGLWWASLVREEPQKSSLTPSPLHAPPPPKQWQIAPLDQSHFVLLQGNTLLLCRFQKPQALEVVDVYHIRHAPQRNPEDPHQKRLHNYYLDSVKVTVEKKLAKLRRDFEGLAKAPAYLEDYTQKARQIAEEIAQLGDYAYLFSFLHEKSPQRLKEAAALALAARGYSQTVPVLVELLRQSGNREERLALLQLLRPLTGLSLSPPPPGESWKEVFASLDKWLQKQKHR